jgi:hypothetical protein
MTQKVKRTRIVSVENDYHIKVKKWCPSCQFKDILNDGTRICTKTQLAVEQRNKCEHWQMSEGLQHAGRSGGVVKLLREVVIH